MEISGRTAAEKKTDTELSDCLIVGSGPAGISAALTLKANGKRFRLFGSPDLSAKLVRAERIRNYPGLSDVTGKEFSDALKAQLGEAEISVTDERVTGVYALKDKFSLLTESGTSFEGRTVILATGVETVKPVRGEEEFVGRGVSYCATCDGFLYKGKKIVVVCTSARFEHEVRYLASLAAETIVVPLYKNPGDFGENAEIVLKKPLAIEGESRVKRVVFPDGARETDGVFMLKESVSPAVLAGGLRTENGHVIVGRDMSANLKGCFAAGDCTGRPYQYAKAVGEGNVAAHSVCAYLAGQET